MPHIRAPAVLFLSVVLALIGVGVVSYPLAASYFSALERERTEARDFVVASPKDQKLIVRSVLLAELAKSPLCNPTDGTCPEEPIYLDRRSAVSRSFDDPSPWMEYELRYIGQEQPVIDRGDGSISPQLLELLSHLIQDQVENVDPKLASVTYVAHIGDLPQLGDHERRGSCTDLYSPRLVRVSRAAVHNSENLAIAYITINYCGAGSWRRVVKLRRSETGWRLLTAANHGP